MEDGMVEDKINVVLFIIIIVYDLLLVILHDY